MNKFQSEEIKYWILIIYVVRTINYMIFYFILVCKNFDDLELMLKILDDKRKRISESGSVRTILV